MSIEIKVPPLPESVSDATLVAWHKKAGEAVERDENLVDLETDKVVLEVPAPAAGILREIKVADGTTVEDRCSGWAVDRAIRAALGSHPNSQLATLCGDTPGGEAKHLTEALAQGDPLAQEILQTTSRNLAFALSHVTHLFHPQVITLGGGLSLIGVPLRKSIEQHLPDFLMDIYGTGPQIKLAELGEDAVPVGALLL